MVSSPVLSFILVGGLIVLPLSLAQVNVADPLDSPLDGPALLDPGVAGPGPDEAACPSSSACVGEDSSTGADCDGDTANWGRNDNATHATFQDPLTYTMVVAYDSCSTGNWWQEYRGVFIVHYGPALTFAGGGYTLEETMTERTVYYVLLSTPVAGFDIRWMGDQREADASCTASIAANVASFRVWDNIPCPLPPPQVPEANWGNILP